MKTIYRGKHIFLKSDHICKNIFEANKRNTYFAFAKASEIVDCRGEFCRLSEVLQVYEKLLNLDSKKEVEVRNI